MPGQASVRRVARASDEPQTLAARDFSAAPGMLRDAVARLGELASQLPPDVPYDVVEAASSSVADADRKAATRLAVDPLVVAVAAQLLWGRSLTDERDRRVRDSAPADASPRSIQAIRGRVTRHLLDEIGEHMQEWRS